MTPERKEEIEALIWDGGTYTSAAIDELLAEVERLEGQNEELCERLIKTSQTLVDRCTEKIEPIQRLYAKYGPHVDSSGNVNAKNKQ